MRVTRVLEPVISTFEHRDQMWDFSLQEVEMSDLVCLVYDFLMLVDPILLIMMM